MQKFKIVRPKKYTNKEGEEKTAWLPVGTETHFDNGGKIMELNHLEETYQIFPLEEKDSPKPNKVDTSDIDDEDYIGNIPFN